MLERVTANDEEAVIVAVNVSSGAAVQAGELIFEFENSKTTQELHAPETGILIHDLQIGMAVAFGVPIARILPPGNAAAASAAQPISPAANLALAEAPAAPVAPPCAPRFSHAALRLIEELGLQTSCFTSSPFVTSREVSAFGRPNGPPSADANPPATVNTPATAGNGIPVGFRKRAEIDVLSRGAGATMLSVLGIRIGRLEIHRKPSDFFTDQITDILIYEASRLMRKYPKLNASYQHAAITEHEHVHAGIAIDNGGRLVVYGIEDADRISLQDLSDVISDAVARYLDDKLTPQELTRATFTVTDMSAGELSFVVPILPAGQSCIIGVTRDDNAGFHLFAGFDHRVTEGREVSEFLRELKQRVISFAAASGPPKTPAASCYYCDGTAEELLTSQDQKGFLLVYTREGKQVMCCAGCWYGW